MVRRGGIMTDKDGIVPMLDHTKTATEVGGGDNSRRRRTKGSKGRGLKMLSHLRNEHEEDKNDLNAPHVFASSGFDGATPLRSVEGWIILVSGVHEEAKEEDLMVFGEFGEVKNLHLNLDRRTEFTMGNALLEYESFAAANEALSTMDGAALFFHKISVNWAFSVGPLRWRRGLSHIRRWRSPRRY